MGNGPSPFLEDYLDRADFAEALRALTGTLGDELGLPARVDEVGLVCPDVQAAALELERKWPGMKPFLLGEGSPTDFVEYDAPADFSTRVGFGFYKGVILELAEPGIGSQIFGQTPNPEGKIVINHVGFAARGPTLTRTDGGASRDFAPVMLEHGLKKRVDAVLSLLGIRGHIYIFETVARTHGIEVEFLDFRLLAEHGPKIRFPAAISGLVGWWQANVGPRLLKLDERQPLAPERETPGIDWSAGAPGKEPTPSGRRWEIVIATCLSVLAILLWGVHGRAELLHQLWPAYLGPGQPDPEKLSRIIAGVPWDQELVSFAFGLLVCVVLPLLVQVAWRKRPLAQLGLALPPRGARGKACGLALLTIAVLALPFAIGARFADMRALYPLYRGDLGGASLVGYELSYLLFFVALDGLLRGGLLFGLLTQGTSPALAVGVETLVQATWHLGKPLGEALGSPVWGLVAGLLSIRCRSVWPAIFAHFVLNVLIDVVALSAQQGVVS
jgi:hypothetical protein